MCYDGPVVIVQVHHIDLARRWREVMWFDPEYHSAVNADVQESVGPLPDAADSPFMVAQQSFFFHHLIVFQYQPVEVCQCHSTDEQVSAPLWKLGSRIQVHAAWSDRRSIIINGLLQAVLIGLPCSDGVLL